MAATMQRHSSHARDGHVMRHGVRHGVRHRMLYVTESSRETVTRDGQGMDHGLMGLLMGWVASAA